MSESAVSQQQQIPDLSLMVGVINAGKAVTLESTGMKEWLRAERLPDPPASTSRPHLSE